MGFFKKQRAFGGASLARYFGGRRGLGGYRYRGFKRRAQVRRGFFRSPLGRLGLGGLVFLVARQFIMRPRAAPV